MANVRAELWLQASDRGLIEIASVIRARLIVGEDIGMTALNQLRLCYAQMGGSSADRSTVSIVEEPERTRPTSISTSRRPAMKG